MPQGIEKGEERVKQREFQKKVGVGSGQEALNHFYFPHSEGSGKRENEGTKIRTFLSILRVRISARFKNVRNKVERKKMHNGAGRDLQDTKGGFPSFSRKGDEKEGSSIKTP